MDLLDIETKIVLPCGCIEILYILVYFFVVKVKVEENNLFLVLHKHVDLTIKI